MSSAVRSRKDPSHIDENDKWSATSVRIQPEPALTYIFVGRLATYKYYNMDQVTAQALSLFNRLTAEAGNESKKKRASVQVAVGQTSLTSIVDVAKSLQHEGSGDIQPDAA